MRSTLRLPTLTIPAFSIPRCAPPMHSRLAPRARSPHEVGQAVVRTRVAGDTVQEFTRLLPDPQIRRYLLDVEIMPSSWCEERINESVLLFQQRGIGIWLVREAISSELVGFCGFLQIIPGHAEPQLVYAPLAPFTRRG